ncbi:hypothetical protein PPTG_00629 [Phytophthora nicotianae INRA-310]|uniref:PX domain-containing protein n=3 Tax=Phytophthora nicotianae TaxID=4792 RepID=W2RFI3_PHYN3|nr:hypothetical protein PPTG_00629 [Phytophthora nicotianae INRA-310]ETI56867.1 hypothetical protein F443_00748 [Phytophthora nicotianae P1569]ETM56327.1 hypothetical protein L914_00686 [Phytophthora nicotianae]ETN24203.1 hypothetical protein PPTG_00629 [Phytophthora nicotianae INRA-310]
MGCNQSKVNNVVVEPITAPPSECGKASMDLGFTEIIIDDHEETSSSIPPAPVKEEVEEEEQHVAPVEEEPTGQPPVDVEEPAAVQESDMVQEPVAVAQAVTVDEPVAAEQAVTVEPPAVAEAEVVEEPSVDTKEDPVDPEVESEDTVEVQVEKSATSVVEKSAVTSVNAPVWTFTADKVSFTIGVAFFNIAGSNTEGDEVYLTKRYSDFKLLHTEMAKLMTREELPRMPGTSFLQGRNDKALLQERETVFVEMLNAIAKHPEASQSAPFAAFLGA